MEQVSGREKAFRAAKAVAALGVFVVGAVINAPIIEVAGGMVAVFEYVSWVGAFGVKPPDSAKPK